MERRRGPVGALALCQALLVTNNISIISLGTLVAYGLADNKAWSTLPATMYIGGGAASSYLLSMLMKKHGRRFGFTLGTIAGMIGTAICTLAVALQSFWIFCLGALIAGVYTASGGFYRFAAADSASTATRSRAISLVLAGGMIGGILGPESTKLTKGLVATPFLATYAVLVLFAAIALVIIRRLDLPPPTDAERTGPTRPLSTIVRQPVFVVACLGAITSYAVMNLLMGATPLAMQMCGLPYSASTLVIESHIIGMFAPALFAGTLVQRFGPLRIMGCGVGAFALCVIAALAGRTVMHFWLASTLLGVGWCFLYVGATTLLGDAATAAEKAKVQGVNDMGVFICMGLFSLVSGAILERLGWNALNYTAVPLIIASGISIAWLGLRQRGAAAALPASR
jgi:MFS family permease